MLGASGVGLRFHAFLFSHVKQEGESMQIRFIGGVPAFLEAVAVFGPLVRSGDGWRYAEASRPAVHAAAERGEIAQVAVDGLIYYPIKHLQRYSLQVRAQKMAREDAASASAAGGGRGTVAYPCLISKQSGRKAL